MLERKDIKDGTLVFYENNDTYHIIEDVGNAREKGDRGHSTTPNDELSYTIVDILTADRYEGICEHSGMTSTFLSVATKIDVDIYLAKLEAEAMITLGMAKKHMSVINDAINRLSKLK